MDPRVPKLAAALDPEHKRDGWWYGFCDHCAYIAHPVPPDIAAEICAFMNHGNRKVRYFGPDLSDPLNLGHLAAAIEAAGLWWLYYYSFGVRKPDPGADWHYRRTLFDAACAACGGEGDGA